MGNDECVLAFIKYGLKEHLESLQKGFMFCNTIQYFSKCEEDNGIGDKYENVYQQLIGTGNEYQIPLKPFNTSMKVVRYPDGSYKSTFINDDFYANFFCMYSLTKKIDFEIQKSFLLSTEMKAYNHMLIISKPSVFLKRVRSALELQVKNPHINFVKYSDINNLNGEKTYFEKPLKYSYQNEFRIAFENDKEACKTVDIGSIEDISEILPVDKCKKVRAFKKDADLEIYLENRSDELYNLYSIKFEIYKTLEKQNHNKTDGKSMFDLTKAQNELKEAELDYRTFVGSIKFG